MSIKQLSTKKIVDSLSPELAFALLSIKDRDLFFGLCNDKIAALSDDQKEALGKATRDKFFDQVSK